MMPDKSDFSKSSSEINIQTIMNFLSLCSHEVMTPLNSIIGFAELLKNNNIAGRERDEYIQHVLDSALALGRFFNDVSELAKLTITPMEPANLWTNFHDVVNDVLFAIKTQAEKKHIALHVEIPNLPELKLAPYILRKILLYLLENAINTTDCSGVSIKVHFRRKSINLGKLYLSISNNGCSMPNENIDKMQIPFQRFSKYAGTAADVHRSGLELQLCYQIISKMNGTLSYKAHRHNRDNFFIAIVNDVEYISQKELKNKKIINPVCAHKSQKLTVLVVDDMSLNVRLMTRMLHCVNIKSIGVQSAKRALEILRNTSVDFVLTDLWMPEMTGVEFANEIRKIPGLAQLPIYVVTADSEANTHFDMSCFDGVLFKPLSQNKLQSLLSKFSVENNT